MFVCEVSLDYRLCVALEYKRCVYALGGQSLELKPVALHRPSWRFAETVETGNGVRKKCARCAITELALAKKVRNKTLKCMNIAGASALAVSTGGQLSITCPLLCLVSENDVYAGQRGFKSAIHFCVFCV